MKLALGVGLLGGLATLMLVGQWMYVSPDKLTLSNGLAGIEQTQIDNYKKLSDVALDNAIKMFDAVVLKALLPIFTSILGYIFGSRLEASRQK